jgi:LysM repeat protein
MTNRIAYILLIVLSALIVSCRASRQPRSVSRTDGSAVSYTEAYKDLAIREMKRSGIPASITLAQGMIESDYGRSTLARTANNHFGIKCHNDWSGPTVRHHDDRRNECFRKYSRPEDSFIDHTDFLMTGSRYGFLFELDHTDYKGWARGLKKAGYATNPDYANMLIRKIEENNLHYFDLDKNITAKNNPRVSTRKITAEEDYQLNKKEIIPANNAKDTGNFVNDVGKALPSRDGSVSAPGTGIPDGPVVALPSKIMENNRIQYMIVKDGDTRESIENEFNLLKWELEKYNDLSPDFIPVPGQVLYLQPKRNKAEAGTYFYFAKQGDTMYSISQKFGIKLKRLFEMNRMNAGEEPAVNQKIWLRTFKPVIR